MRNLSKYEQRGVSFSKKDVHLAISNIDKGISPYSFCKIIPDYLSGDENYGLIMHSDGAGTKSSLAYAYWKETQNLNIWKNIAQDALVMNIDDMICAGATENFIISTTIGRNKKLIQGEVIKAIIEGVEEFIEFLSKYEINAYSAGGETADVGDLVRTIIVDTTVVSRIRKAHIISNFNIKHGDVIIGLSSFGKSTYETSYNSGIGSNGLTSARHDIFSSVLRQKYPETYDNTIDDNLTYIGNYNLTDPSPVENIDMGSFVLSPTRTYAPIMKEVLNNYRNDIHGIIHCTGGGQTKVLNFINNVKVVKNNLFPMPDVFKIIHKESKTPLKEMYSVFNMGHRLEIYLPEKKADDIINIAKKYNVEAQIIGYCEKSENKEVVIINNEEKYIYN